MPQSAAPTRASLWLGRGFALTLAPQAYLAWTLAPLDEADDETAQAAA